ncbi:MAG TPA: hypothetical protein VK149_09255 [Sideroxyarcus sp.]|nr:hypothetical protein [Sideroxyarcus sp.]
METAIKICAIPLLCAMATATAMAEGLYAAAEAWRTAACNGMTACTGSSYPAGRYGFAPISGIGLSRTAPDGSTAEHSRNAGETSADGSPRYGHILSSVESRFGSLRIQPILAATPDASAGSDPVYGIGAQYDFNHDLALHARYERLGATDGADSAGTSLLSVDAVYRF